MMQAMRESYEKMITEVIALEQEDILTISNPNPDAGIDEGEEDL